MKNIVIKLFAFCLLLLGTNLHAQQDWQWGQRVGVQVEDMTTDSHGNTYVLWDLFGSYTIDGHAITGYSIISADIALTSFSCNGAYRWTRVIGGNSGAQGRAVGVDTLGGVYLTGGISSDNQDSIYVSGDTIIAPTAKRMILVKYDTAGNFQWLRMPEPDTENNLSGYSSFLFNMDVSPNGNCYCYCLLEPGSYANGTFTATYPFDFLNYHGSCVYTLEYDRNGNCIGGTHLDMYFSGPALIFARFVRDPLSGNYYLNGYIDYGSSDTLKFGDTVLTNSNGDLPAYIAAFDSLGDVKWVKVVNDSLSYFPSNLLGRPAIDNAGNIYVTGCSYNGNSFGNYNFHNTFGQHGFPILAKLSPSGDVLWATNASTNGGNTGKASAVSNSIVAVAGEYGGKIDWNGLGANNTQAHNEAQNIFFPRFNTATGAIISFDTLASSLLANERAAVLTSDSKGNFYVGGTFEGALYVANDTIYNQSSQQDGFIAKFGNANCNCVLPTAHYTHGSLSNGGVVSFTYDGSQPVDSVIWDFGDNQTATGTTVNHTYTQDGDYTVCATAFNSCGTNMTCQTLHIETGLGIGGFPEMARLRVFPNPAVQTLTIDGVQPGTQLEIYDGLGRRGLQQQLHSNQETLNVSHLTPGIYLLLFTDENGNKGSVKVVKE